MVVNKCVVFVGGCNNKFLLIIMCGLNKQRRNLDGSGGVDK